MTLRLRDTLSRSLVPVEPIDGGHLRMYSCGPTVYRFAHIGNLRTFFRADVAALGPAPLDGPWVPPEVLEAGASPARPEGRAPGVTGHGGGDGPAISDRAGASGVPLSAIARRLHDRFAAAIDADLDTPRALRTARETLRAPISADERRWLVLDMDFVLGLDLHLSVPAVATSQPPGAQGPPSGAAALLAERGRARAAHDWAAADRLREELRALGIEPNDRADGTSGWRRTARS